MPLSPEDKVLRVTTEIELERQIKALTPEPRHIGFFPDPVNPWAFVTYEATGFISHTQTHGMGNVQFDVDPWKVMAALWEMLGYPDRLFRGKSTLWADTIVIERQIPYQEKHNRYVDWREVAPFYIECDLSTRYKESTSFNAYSSGASINFHYLNHSLTWKEMPIDVRVEIKTTADWLDIEIRQKAYQKHPNGITYYGTPYARKNGAWVAVNYGTGAKFYQYIEDMEAANGDPR